MKSPGESGFVAIAIGNRCPRCSRGKIFRGFYSMNRKCKECGFVFEREAGYFLGAMMASYFIGGFTLIPTMVVGLFILKREMVEIVCIGTAQILFLHPFLFKYSRLVWMAAEHRMTDALVKETKLDGK